MYEERETSARILRVATGAYGRSGRGLVDVTLKVVHHFQTVVAGDPAAEAWAQGELA